MSPHDNPADRRAHVRQREARRVLCHRAGAEPTDALLWNLSRGGLCLWTRFPCEHGEHLEVEVPEQAEPVRLPLTVVWQVPGASGLCQVGGRFGEVSASASRFLKDILV